MKSVHSSDVVALPRAAPEVIAGNVFDKYRSRNPVVKALVGSFLDTMLTMVRPIAPRRLLEVGCGDGYVLDFLSRHLTPARAVGVDLSTDVVSRAKRCYPHLAFGAGSAYCLPYAARSFDLVVVSEVLEHLAQPALALEEIQRVSARYCLFSVPHEPWWRVLNVLRLKYVSDWGNTPGHVQHFTAAAFLDLLRSNGHVRRFARPIPWLMALWERRP